MSVPWLLFFVAAARRGGNGWLMPSSPNAGLAGHAGFIQAVLHVLDCLPVPLCRSFAPRVIYGRLSCRPQGPMGPDSCECRDSSSPPLIPPVYSIWWA
ncbi:hypothetical protein B0T16DRAFT_131447 [Cercophora newfieldiana]|uniref:Secreted protein n=1 Tax=Cercophora newfieldiana TaxID=92897 RepID=A0AA39YB96_9PEZI|nr:hypothetical protein B0T16DRAFT_131447 [Cercophora newfieldiana]